MVSAHVQKAAVVLLEQLDGGWLIVGKFPGRHGEGLVRLVMERNALWYRAFAKAHERRRKGRYRKSRTIIKRCWTRKTLIGLTQGRDGTLYSCRLIEFIEHWLEQHDGKVPHEH